MHHRSACRSVAFDNLFKDLPEDVQQKLSSVEMERVEI